MSLVAPSITAGSNEVYAAWHTPGGGGTQAEVFFVEKSGNSWSSPAVINPGTIGPHSLSLDNSGKIHLLYHELESPFLTFYRTYDGVTWAEPVSISDEKGHSQQWPSIAIDSTNKPHVVWPFTPTGNNARLYYSKSDGSEWSAALTLTPSDTFSYLPRVSVDNSGIIHVVWLDFNSKDVYYKKFEGGSWSNSTLLSNPALSAGDPDLAVDYNGNVNVVWAYGAPINEIYYTNWNGTTWSTPENASNLGSNSQRPSITIDSENNLHLVWQSSSEIFYKKREGNEWNSEYINISNNPSTSWHSNIVSDSDGGLHVVWLNNTDEGTNHVFYSTLASEGKKLNVELMRSIWEPWNNDIYDHADVFNPGCGTTIGQCGCALTSITMLLNYHGAIKDQNGSPINPETLNNFFKLDESPTTCKANGISVSGRKSKGYSCGGVIWTAADEYSKKAFDAFGTQKIRFVGKFSGHNPDLYRQEIDENNPIIAQVIYPDPHWLIINGYVDNTFWINDPGFDRDRLDHPQLQNQTLAYVRYEKAASDFSGLLIATSNPDQILVTDPDGNQTGFNPENSTNIFDIPGSSYFFDQAIADDSGVSPPPHPETGNNILYINLPQEGDYDVKHIPGSDGSYGFAVYAYDRDANLILNGFEGEAPTGQENSYKFEYSPEPGETTLALDVSIDILPFVRKNLIFYKRNYLIPIVILSTDTFDATSELDETSLTFGRTGDEKSLLKCIRPRIDVNRDVLKDNICLFLSKTADFQKGNTDGILKGQLTDGTYLTASDSIITWPK